MLQRGMHKRHQVIPDRQRQALGAGVCFRYRPRWLSRPHKVAHRPQPDPGDPHTMLPDRRRFSRLSLALALAGLSAPAVMAQGSTPRRIVLGQSVPLTGAAAEIGLAFAAGAKLYVDAFNSRKNNPGWTFELRQLDDGYDPRRAQANATRLLADGADVLFGFVGTAASEAAARVAAADGALLFAPFAAPDTLRGAGQGGVFHVRPSLADEAFKMVRHAATLGQTRLAVVAEDDAMGRAGTAAVQAAIAELKLPAPVAVALVPVNSDKVDDAVAGLLRSQAQAVILVSLFSSSAAVIRKARAGGFAGTFMGFSVVGIDPLFTALGKDIGGVVVSQVVPSPRSTATPIVREYLAALENTDQSPSYESLEGYIAAKALAEGVRRAGRGADRARLQAAFAGMTDWDIGGFRVNLRPGIRDAVRSIDLVTIRADGRVVR
jgi:ABC-type branched-subunit amino acid transport system substrate-binding protein